MNNELITTEEELGKEIPRLICWTVPLFTLQDFKNHVAEHLRFPDPSGLVDRMVGTRVDPSLNRAVELWDAHTRNQKLIWLERVRQSFKKHSLQDYLLVTAHLRNAEDPVTSELAMDPNMLRFFDVFCHWMDPEECDEPWVLQRAFDLAGSSKVTRWARKAWDAMTADMRLETIKRNKHIIWNLGKDQRLERLRAWRAE